MGSTGNVELDLSNGGYGGDFSYDSTGDIKLAIDSNANVSASIQRLYRLICTNAFTKDAEGNVIARPDDLFNRNYGATIRAYIGEPFDDSFISNVTSRIVAALMTDAGVKKFPVPSVTITNEGNGLALIDVECTLTSGRLITLPTIPLRVG